MKRFFFTIKDVTKELGAELRLLQRGQTLTAKIARDLEGDFEVVLESSDNPFSPKASGFDVT